MQKENGRAGGPRRAVNDAAVVSFWASLRRARIVPRDAAVDLHAMNQSRPVLRRLDDDRLVRDLDRRRRSP